MEHVVIFFPFVLLLGLFSQSEGAKHWRSAKAEVTAIQGESATLAWSINLTDSDVNKTWTYVKIIHEKGPCTEELVTFEKTGEKTIENPSYSSRISDMTFNVSQSGSAVNIRFTMANLVRATDMKSYKAMLGFDSDASTYPGVTILTILVKPHSNELKIKPEKNTYCLGDKVIVTCKADGIPPPQISLFLNGKLVQSENTSVAVTLSLNVKGEKNLDCVTNNTAGIGQTNNVKLVVKGPPKKINGTFILTNASWSENLKNPSSGAYFKLNTKINQALELVYANEEFVTAWRILSFVNRKGSVGVNFQLDVIANVTDPIILLKHAVDKNGGKLNGLSIDRNSIKTGYLSTTKDGETASKKKESDNKTEMYVGIVVGIIAVIFVLLVVLVICCKRKGKRKSARRSNESTGMEMIRFYEESLASPQGGNVTFERTMRNGRMAQRQQQNELPSLQICLKETVINI